MTAHIFPRQAEPQTLLNEGLPLTMYQEVLRLLTERAPEDLFRSIVPTVLSRVLQLLDPLSHGVVVSVLLCTPPITGRLVRSLSTRLSQGTPPLSEEISQSPLFFGAESLAASVALSGHVAVVPDTSDLRERQLFVSWGRTRFIATCPIKRFGRCAGCLTLLSTTPTAVYDLTLLQEAAFLIGFTLPEQEFFKTEQMSFQVMPLIQAQSDLLSTYRERFLGIVDEARRNGQTLDIQQAELLALQQFEEKLVQLALQRDVKIRVRV